MRISISVQLSAVVLLCSLLALMVLALATWFQTQSFITSIRLSALSLTASLKAAQLSSNLLLFQASVQSISSRILIQNALRNYNAGNITYFQTNLITTATDLRDALSSGATSIFLLQAIIFPIYNDGSGGKYGLINVTEAPSVVQLPYNYSNGSSVYLGDPGPGYPPQLYPNLTYSATNSSTVNPISAASFDGRPIYSNTTILVGPYVFNSTYALLSITVPIINNTSQQDVLGYLTVVLDVSLIYQVIDSPEGLDGTGEILLVGPVTSDNHFTTQIRGSSAANVRDQQVHFVLPPQSNSTLDNRHPLHAVNGSELGASFQMNQYPAVVDAWTARNNDINNAGSIISTKNEEGKHISAGYAIVSTPMVDWVLVFEQSYALVVSPIDHLRNIVVACVFGTVALLLFVVGPMSYFSVAPIRALRAATKRTVEPYHAEGSSTSGYSVHESSDGSAEGDEENLTTVEARKEGFLGAISRWKGTGKRKEPPRPGNVTQRRTFRIPGKVPERRHWVYDELTDLTSTFNEMSEELLMQYERLEERVKQRTAQLEQSKKAAEVANESKTLFIANISHELKTPLNGILGLCAVCMQENDIHKVRSTLGTIYKSGDLLLHLLTDLLTFSKNSIGQQLQIDESEFRLSDLGTQLVPIFEKQARENQIDFRLIYQGTNDAFGNTSDDVGEKLYGPSGTGRVKDMTLWGDKNRILQVLMNFTSNSLKFTPPKGSVIVRIRCVGIQEHVISRASSTRKPSVNSRRSRNSKTSKVSKSSQANSRKSGSPSNIRDSRENPSKTGDHSTSGEDSKLSINVAGGTAQIAKVAERRRSMSPPPLNTKDLVFEFEVEDTGPGIPAEQQQKIFEPFVQGDLGLSKKYGGTGLGLSICAQLAALMGGGITLNSTVGEGSIFMMQIPLRFVSERAASFASSHRAHGSADSLVGQPLYDDTNPENVEHILSYDTGDLPTPDKLADVPRIVGFTQPYLAKDVNESPKQKIDEMKKAEINAERTGQKVRVLVAEDNKVNQEVVLRMLKLEDVYDVTIAKDGQEAFDKVRASMEASEKFDLIFMDVQMPNLDGIQSTKKIREMGFSAPIVALTAFAEKSNEEECMASGMDYFLPKPIRRPALKQVLKKYCATIPEEDGDGATVPASKSDAEIKKPPLNRGSPVMRATNSDPNKMDANTTDSVREVNGDLDDSTSPLS